MVFMETSAALQLNRKRRGSAATASIWLVRRRCFRCLLLLLRQRLFEQRQLALHDLHVVDLFDGLALVLHRVLVIAGGVVAAAERIEVAGLAGFAVAC